MAAYRRVYDSPRLQADCQEPGSALEPCAWQSSMDYPYLFTVYPRTKIYMHRVPKKRNQTHVSNCVNSQPIFHLFSLSYSLQQPKFAATSLLEMPLHLICVATPPCETLTSENERQSQTDAVINDKLHGAVVACSRCGGTFNNQIKKGLWQNLPEKNVLHSCGQKSGLCRALSSTFSKLHETTTFFVLTVTLPNFHTDFNTV